MKALQTVLPSSATWSCIPQQDIVLNFVRDWSYAADLNAILTAYALAASSLQELSRKSQTRSIEDSDMMPMGID